jgi:hypothetical protein
MSGLSLTLALSVNAAPAHRAECTSLCHLFEAYALAHVCPNLVLNQRYSTDFRGLFADEAAMPRFKVEALSAVFKRISKAVNVCSPSCLKLRVVDGTACQYLKSRPTIPDEN